MGTRRKKNAEENEKEREIGGRFFFFFFTSSEWTKEKKKTINKWFHFPGRIGKSKDYEKRKSGLAGFEAKQTNKQSNE